MIKTVKLVNVKRRTFNGVKFNKTVNVEESNVDFYLRNGFEVVTKVTEKVKAQNDQARAEAEAQAEKDAQAQAEKDAQNDAQAELDAEYEENRGDDEVPEVEETEETEETEVEENADADLEELNKELEVEAPKKTTRKRSNKKK